jgi:lysophospholipase L1-like esterase
VSGVKRKPILFVALLALLLLAAALPAPASANEPRELYVSLGDSLSVGVQQDESGENVLTRNGYPRQLAKKVKGVKLVEFGCANTTTEEFIKGAKCAFPTHNPGYENNSPKTSQLATAERFLRKHRDRIAFVTIDLGANDLLDCAEGGAIDITCVSDGVAGIERNVPKIARRLREAAGKRIPMATMTLYDPYLEQWFHGDAGKLFAQASVALARDQVNPAITQGFKQGKFKIARVAEAFDTYEPFENTTTYGAQTGVPVAVAQICELTAMCKPPPLGPDIHATDAGYAVIAAAFRKALGKAAQ